MQDSCWRPDAPIHNLRARARILAQIRQFFAERRVMEVETPVLSRCAVSDPFIDSLEVSFGFRPGVEEARLYLQTSPEYAMKRLLAAGSGDIYQMAKVFRNGESGPRHNPEFTLLEWYRLGFDDRRLMSEVDALLRGVLPEIEVRYLSYAQLFETELGMDPHCSRSAGSTWMPPLKMMTATPGWICSCLMCWNRGCRGRYLSTAIRPPWRHWHGCAGMSRDGR